MRMQENPSDIHIIEVESPITSDFEWEKVERRDKRKQLMRETQQPQGLPNQRSQHRLPNALVI